MLPLIILQFPATLLILLSFLLFLFLFLLFVRACYGIAVFTLAGISLIAFQADNRIAFVTMLILLTIYSTVYQCYAKKNQFFSVDEKFIFLVTHLAQYLYTIPVYLPVKSFTHASSEYLIFNSLCFFILSFSMCCCPFRCT